MPPENHQKWTGSSAAYLDTQARDAWAEEARERGGRGSQRILSADEVPAPHRDFGPTAVRRRRLMLLDDTPVELVDSYWPLDVARETPLAGTRRVRGGATAYLAELGYRPAEVDEYVQADGATEEEAHLLGAPVGSPVLVLVRQIRAAGGRLYEVTRTVTRSGAGGLRYSMRTDSE